MFHNLDDFNVLNDLKMHLAKLRLCFDKCRKFDISLNLEKCMFFVYLKVLLGHVVSKARKLFDSQQYPICPHQKCLKMYKFSMGWPSFIDVSLRILFSSWPPP